ncbi:DNA repair ATPase [Kibdelosporangium philippinense]|uniref:DNA repair ATPase n=1 Tax=Kibdelosporangium philippinense TaxID=211113 RepID=A0ABS8ZGM6_9PSEU|nr:DNA repair ATPase [Kibdelosporangium philippinense]MCE7006692.1 DNA repair ATPase [Kibdelosporangium philippinense]
MTAVALDEGTYELLRARLAEHAAALAARAEELNTKRIEVFGGTELRLIGTERIRTENNCVPRDVVPVNGSMLFGYNVFIGLRPETEVKDVFSLHSFVRDGDAFRFDDASVAGLLEDQQFQHDFAELYRYYKETRLLQLRRMEGKLLAVFQTGANATDIKVMRWNVTTDGKVSYEDNRGERDHVFPPSHDFEWVETTRDDHVLGRHPHVSIQNEMFIEAVGGDLTIKLENNTETGEGIYSEPVTETLQSLADADIAYARVGTLILLKIRPYKETEWRYLVFNTQTKGVARLDGIGQACQRLPEDQGIIFPGGYYLATGVAKTFDTDVTSLEFERMIRSTNGEDVLYVFHARAEGRYLLLPYNVIRKEVGTSIPCHGYSLFDDGTLVVFRAVSDEPTRVHPMQVWQTPYLSDTYAAAQETGEGPLGRVGNADLVRGISDCLSVSRMVGEMAPSTEVFEGLIAACDRAFDHYHWLGEQELGDLRTPLSEVRATAEQVLDEFEGVQALTNQAATALASSDQDIASLVRKVRGEAPKSADAWVTQLAELRKAQGHLITLKEMRYIDTARIESLNSLLTSELGTAAKRAVEFLSGENAFAGYHAEVERLVAEGAAIKTVAEAAPVQERLDSQAEGLELLTQVVSSLDIADATVRTRILSRVGEVLGGINRARATVDGRRRELAASEGRAEFAAEFALLGQAITGALAVADTPQKCDEGLGRLMLQLENLESRFGEFDDFMAELSAKRTDVYEAFSARKQALLDSRARRADRLVESAQRILGSVQRRAGQLETLDDVNTYFAGDPMVAKLRAVADDLRALGDQVRADELDGRIKAARQEAGRSLRDRLDLYADGGETIKLGRHVFAVNTQAMDLTVVPHEDGLAIGITGTDFRDPVVDAEFEATRPFWNQLLVSETPEVYRGEFLATVALDSSPWDESAVLEHVRKVAETRYDEGYELGVHDHDAAKILEAILRLRAGAGVLRYPPQARAAATIFWSFGPDEAAKKVWSRRAGSLARARAAFGHTPAIDELAAELTDEITAFLSANGLSGDPLAGEYLFEELSSAPFGFVTSAGARSLVDRFRRKLGTAKDFDDDLRAIDGLAEKYQLISAWLSAFLGGAASADLAEAIALELCRDVPRHDSSASLEATVDGLLGSHPRIVERKLTFRLDELLARMRQFHNSHVPAFRAYQKERAALVSASRRELRFEEFQPKVMSAFVRNGLLDEVYLPLIGDNLAKQLGTAGESKRTDQMGLLLLISPPGYGKTTLMEYVANRLGLVFVKVNGPALGHSVTSVDPAEAPNATARQEIEKISFALEMGSNVLLYLDDIQHTSPELLQKFISLCDAQRRMEGVWNGKTKTYDLRGKRFAVCMAGNPYTESGQRFRIPDMLANRADVWNLGDVLSGKEDLFALSFVENSLTSNVVLAPLSTRDRSDVPKLVRLAVGDPTIRPDQLAHPYSSVELDQVLSVLRKLLTVQKVVLANNQAYIASAAQSDASRVEPPYQLQGSYRNMNKLAEKIVPAMNDAELAAVVDDHYLAEAQTLTSGAEANLLKLGELRGTLTPEQAKRWADVKAAYVRERALGGDDDDPMSRAVGAVGLLADQVGTIASAIRGD